MIKITVGDTDYQYDPDAGKSLMQQLVDQGVDIMAACGGAGLCTTCGITVKQGEFSEKTPAEEDMCLPEGQRLSCQCHPLTDSEVDLMYG